MEVRTKRVGGASYQVPVEVRGDRRIALAIRWIIEFAKKRSNKEFHTFSEKLVVELMEAATNQGEAIKKETPCTAWLTPTKPLPISGGSLYTVGMRAILTIYLVGVVSLFGFMVWKANDVRVCYIPVQSDFYDISYSLKSQQEAKMVVCSRSYEVILELKECIKKALPKEGNAKYLSPYIVKNTNFIRVLAKMMRY